MVDCYCGERAVFDAGGPLCREHFKEWLRKEARKELSNYVSKSDVMAVAVSGGKDSTTLLDIANEWSRESGTEIFAICIDEGISGYRDETLKFIRGFCGSRIPLHIFSFAEEFGKTLDECLAMEGDARACTVCGTLRRYLLNKYSRQLGATCILFAHNLDDELQTLFMNLFAGNLPQISRKGELVGIIDHPQFVVRMKPLIHIPEKALATYALLNYEIPDVECPYLGESSRTAAREFINSLESRSPGSKSRLMGLYLDRILPALKPEAHRIHEDLKKCARCGEPSSKEVCKVCEFRELFKLV